MAEYKYKPSLMIDDLLKGLQGLKQEAASADKVIGMIGNKGNLNKLLAVFLNMDNLVEQLRQDSDKLKSSFGEQLKSGYLTDLDGEFAKLSEGIKKIQAISENILNINLKKSDAPAQLKALAEQINTELENIGSSDKIDIADFLTKGLKEQRDVLIDYVNNLGKELTISVSKIDTSALGGVGDAIAGEIEDAGKKVQKSSKKLSSIVKSAIKSYYNAIIDENDAAKAKVKQELSNALIGELGANNFSTASLDQILFDLDEGNIEEDQAKEKIIAMVGSMKNALQSGKAELVDAFKEYYNAIDDAINNGVNVVDGDVSDAMQTIEDKIGDMLPNLSKTARTELFNIFQGLISNDIGLDDIEDTVNKFILNNSVAISVPIKQAVSEVQDESSKAGDAIQQEADKTSTAMGEVEDKTNSVTDAFTKLVNDITRSGSTPKEFFDNLESGAKSTTDAIEAENKALAAQIVLKEKAQSMTWKNFAMDESLSALKQVAGLNSLVGAEQFWQQANYDKKIDYKEIDPYEARNIIENKIGSLVDDWVGGVDFSAKAKIENAVLADPELRNAAMNWAYHIVQTYAKDILKGASFEEFLNTEYDMFRSDNGPTLYETGQKLSFAFTSGAANGVQGEAVERSKKIKPTDTIGAISTGSYADELEMFLPMSALPQGDNSLYIQNSSKSFNEYFSNLNKKYQGQIKAQILELEQDRVKNLLGEDLTELVDNAFSESGFILKDLDIFKQGIVPEKLDIANSGWATEYTDELAIAYNNGSEMQKKLIAYYASLTDDLKTLKDKNIEPPKNHFQQVEIGQTGLINAVANNPSEFQQFADEVTGVKKFNFYGNATQNINEEAQAHQNNTQAIEQESAAQDELNKKKTSTSDQQQLPMMEDSSQEIQNENTELSSLLDKIGKVQRAVELKTQAFRDEAITVDGVVTQEMESLQRLADYLGTLRTLINGLFDGLNPSEIPEIDATKFQPGDNSGGIVSNVATGDYALENTLQSTNSILELIFDAVTSDDNSKLATALEAAIDELKKVSSGIIEEKKKQAIDTTKASDRIVDPKEYDSILNSISSKLADTSSEIQVGSMKALANGIVQVNGAMKNTEGVWEGFTAKVDETGKVYDIVTNKQSKLAKSLNDVAESTEKEQKVQDRSRAKAEAATKKEEKTKAIYGNQQVINAQAEHNSLSKQAQPYIKKGSTNIDEALFNYDDALRRLIDTQEKFSNIQDINSKEANQLKTQFKEAQNECTNYATKLKKLISASEKFQADAQNVISIEGFDTSTIEGVRAALKDYVQSTYGAAAGNLKFDDTTGKLSFTVKDAEGKLHNMIAALDATGTMAGTTSDKLQKTTSMFDGFISGVSKKWKELLTYFTARIGVDEIFQQIRQGVQYVRDIDSALTELKKVTDETDVTYQKFLRTASKTAGVIGSTVKDFTNATADFARLIIKVPYMVTYR